MAAGKTASQCEAIAPMSWALTMPLPSRSPGAAPVLSQCEAMTPMSFAFTIPSWLASPGKTLKEKRKSALAPPPEGKLLTPSIQLPNSGSPAVSLTAVGPVDARSSDNRSVPIGWDNVHVAVCDLLL